MIVERVVRHATSLLRLKAQLRLAVCLLGLLAIPATAAAQPTYVSLTFDDSTASQLPAEQALVAHGFGGTFYVIDGDIGTDSYFMNWPQVHRVAGDGMEIGGHTFDHPNLTTLTPAQQQQEICQNRQDLIAQGFTPTSFSYPYAAWNPTARAAVAQCGFTSGRGVGDIDCGNCSTAESLPPPDPFVLRTPASITDTTPVTAIEGEVQQAEATGGWIILVFHTFCDSCHDPNSWPLGNFTSLLDWLQTQTHVQVKTVGQVMAAPVAAPPANLLANPSLEQGLGPAGPACWERQAYAGATGGGNDGLWSDVPGAHTGANAENVQITTYRDGNQKLVAARDPTVAVPASATPVVASAGGALSSGTYYYAITGTTPYGETPAGSMRSVLVNGSTSAVDVKWATVAGATGYNVYRGMSPASLTLIGSVGAIGSYWDEGGHVGAPNVPPITNTAAQTNCAPAAVPGHVYQASLWYQSSPGAKVTGIVYYRDRSGVWQLWQTLPLTAPAATWQHVSWQTGQVPAGATAISVGVTLSSTGSATFDDFALGDLSGTSPPNPPPPSGPAPKSPVELLQNGSLDSTASGGPACWLRTYYAGPSGAGNIGTVADTADAHSSPNAETISITGYADGDRKLISDQDVLAEAPPLNAATASASGGVLAAGTYYYEVTATTPYGQTTPSAERSVTSTGGSSSVRLAFTQVAGAAGYRVYRASASGAETLLASVGVGASSYIDTGSTVPSAPTPPPTNTANRTNCAPTGVAGHLYDVSSWYRTSLGAAARMVSYYRDSGGNWQFWQQQLVPASVAWTQVVWQTLPFPVGATEISVGFSLTSVGSATFDDLFVGDLSVAP